MLNKKPIKAYFCPKCNSVKVKFIFGLGNLYGVMPKMKCDSCGFSLYGSFPQVTTYPKPKNVKKSPSDKNLKKIKINKKKTNFKSGGKK